MSDVVANSNSVENIAEMTAIGLGLPRDFIKDAGKYGLVTYVYSFYQLINVCRG
jgi:hypothetical protein